MIHHFRSINRHMGENRKIKRYIYKMIKKYFQFQVCFQDIYISMAVIFSSTLGLRPSKFWGPRLPTVEPMDKPGTVYWRKWLIVSSSHSRKTKWETLNEVILLSSLTLYTFLKMIHHFRSINRHMGENRKIKRYIYKLRVYLVESIMQKRYKFFEKMK
jgi:cell fate (sporulation/competence/biofilm development) regulator YmcA (YheA/YmcA/DUF963 family)